MTTRAPDNAGPERTQWGLVGAPIPAPVMGEDHGPHFYVVPSEPPPGYVVMRTGEPDALLGTTHYSRAVQVAEAWERGEDTPPAFHREAFIDGYVEAALWADCMPAGPLTQARDFFDTQSGPHAQAIRAALDLVGDDAEAEDYARAKLREWGEDPEGELGGRAHLTMRPEARKRFAIDCHAFIDANLADLSEYVEQRPGSSAYDDSQGPPEAYAGHDLWLTRRGHGCGFWDRGLGELGDRLTAASEAMGEPFNGELPFDVGDGTADV